MKPRRYCFVVPRYFDGIAGGAETLMGEIARHLAKRGDSVELLATCAKDNRTWANELPAGESFVDGIRVTRFPVNERDLEAWVPIQVAIHEGQSVNVDQQLLWMRESVNSDSMYRHIKENRDSFDLFFFGPYLFGSTFWGSMINPEKSVLVPCLHDEPCAYLDVIAAMFRGVIGCLFNSAPEMQLARSLYGEIAGGVVGMGFSRPALPSDAISERARNERIPRDKPYILYLGRKEMGKNVHVLIDYFIEAKRDGLIPEELQLAVLGGGSFSDLHRTEVLERGDIIDLPHVGEDEKRKLIAESFFLCQPSTNESFSIVLMEAWMVGTPVVVHGECAVTRYHVIESGGGLYFSSPGDLAGVIRYLWENPEARALFAARGAAYVDREYSWQAVLSRFDATVDRVMESAGSIASQGEVSIA
jgi:glycosyltransferase involved in cell wall biosynthesis